MTAADSMPLALTAPPGWLVRGRNHIASECGRFNVFLAEATGDWVCVDWDVGCKVYGDARAELVAWCEERAAPAPTANR